MVRFRAVLVKKIPTRNELNRRINEVMEEFNRLNMDMFESTTATFQTHRVAFEKVEKFTPNHKEVAVLTDDEIYGYLENGTSVRYATMGPRFSPKTAPKRIRATPGNSDVAYINKNRPRPGIKARKFSESILKELKPKYFDMVSRVILEFTEDYNG